MTGSISADGYGSAKDRWFNPGLTPATDRLREVVASVENALEHYEDKRALKPQERQTLHTVEQTPHYDGRQTTAANPSRKQLRQQTSQQIIRNYRFMGRDFPVGVASKAASASGRTAVALHHICSMAAKH
jgi:hypothetical protein